jgi:hypothetical protein
MDIDGFYLHLQFLDGRITNSHGPKSTMIADEPARFAGMEGLMG